MLAAVLGVSPAAALTGNQLAEYCRNGADRNPGCFYYIQGVVDAQVELHSAFRIALICFPSKVTNGQIAQIVAKYLNDTPSELHFPATTLVSNALHKAFPCEKK